MRIATWNINGLRARFDFVMHWLDSRRPDVVGLQELKLEDQHFPYLEFEAHGYFVAAETQKAWNGVAILSRTPPAETIRGLPGQEELGARLISSRIGDLRFINLYCPNGRTVGHPEFARKLDWLDSLRSFLDQFDPQQQIVVGGDFNLCPAASDSWNEEGFRGRIFHTEAERDRFRGLLSWGLFDLYRETFPSGRAFSWWDYRAGAFHQNRGLRIDLLLGSQSILNRLQTVEIDRDYRKKKEGMTASDHAPVLADLDLDH